MSKPDHSTRRTFMRNLGLLSGSLALGSGFLFSSCQSGSGEKSDTETNTSNDDVAIAAQALSISLAQWSLHNRFFGESIKKGWEYFGNTLRSDPDALLQGEADPADFPRIAREEFDIEAIELVNTFYLGKIDDRNYWERFRDECIEYKVQPLIIMCDALGDLGDADPEVRAQTVENHHKWVDLAKFLGCHSIRVNAAGEGSAAMVAQQAVDGLRQLTEYGAEQEINIIVENHGGYSSDGKWLSGVIAEVGSPYCGTLPDFGNFCIEGSPRDCQKAYDRYQGMKELLPYAKGVSAKSYAFDADGDERTIDFFRMIQLVREAGFAGYVGIEYEGDELSEAEGIKATKELLQKAFLYVTE